MLKFISTYILLITSLFVSAACFSQKVPDADFLFPMDIAPSVSGSFAELRSNHFHSGIDLSTNGKQGIPVKSMERGEISRIKISPVGYGNAIYIKHPNGYTSVYGHLRNFSSKIDSIITQEQYKIKSFAIDYFPQQTINIDRGETIGYSGNSGSSGGPHLHYEIRDTYTEEPINPFLFQNIIKDDVRPKILTIRIYPLDENSLINGKNTPLNFPVVFYDGSYHLINNPKIHASGKVGIAVQMLDYMSGSWKKCGVYKLDMKVDKQDYFNWELNRFSFAESRYINSHIDYAYKKTHGIRFEKCFKDPGNQLSIYHRHHNNGIILMDTLKNISIKASDAAGNAAILNFNLYKGVAPTESTIDNGKLSYQYKHHLIKDGVECNIPKGALYNDAFIDITRDTTSNGNPLFKIGEETTPLHKAIQIKVSVPEKLLPLQNQLCFAKINGNNKSVYAGGNLSGNTLILGTNEFGDYFFATDSIQPYIRALQNIKGKVFTPSSKLRFKITDNFSGINTYNGYLNDQWVLFEYDKKSDLLTCQLRKAKVKKGGNYKLKLIITDNCGNTQTLESSFMVR